MPWMIAVRQCYEKFQTYQKSWKVNAGSTEVLWWFTCVSVCVRVCPCVCVVTGGKSTHGIIFWKHLKGSDRCLKSLLAFDPLHVSSKASPCAAEAAGVPPNSTASPRTAPRRRSEGGGPQSSEAHPCTLVSSDLGQTPLPGLVHLQRQPVGFPGAAAP